MSKMLTIPRWDIKEVKNWEELFVANDDGTKELNLVTSILISYTMAIGVNEITEDNIDDVSCRIALLEAVFGTGLMSGQKSIFITRDDVARHVGLRTESDKIELVEFWARMRNLNRVENSRGLRAANDDATALHSLYRL